MTLPKITELIIQHWIVEYFRNWTIIVNVQLILILPFQMLNQLVSQMTWLIKTLEIYRILANMNVLQDNTDWKLTKGAWISSLWRNCWMETITPNIFQMSKKGKDCWFLGFKKITGFYFQWIHRFQFLFWKLRLRKNHFQRSNIHGYFM